MLIIYITFTIINLIICSILAYSDYKNYKAITVADVLMDLIMVVSSFIGTVLIIFSVWDCFGDKVIIQRKRNER